MIWSAFSLRLSRGDRLMVMLAWLTLPPIKKPTPAMSGSWVSTWATALTFCAALAIEASCEVIITPLRKPVSCCGKKPVGTVA